MGNQTNSAAEPRRISKTIRYFYGVGDMCFALMTNVGVYYSAFYLTNVDDNDGHDRRLYGLDLWRRD